MDHLLYQCPMMNRSKRMDLNMPQITLMYYFLMMKMKVKFLVFGVLLELMKKIVNTVYQKVVNFLVEAKASMQEARLFSQIEVR